MKKLIPVIAIAGTILSGCTPLTYQEKVTLRGLKAQGITVDRPAGNWECPANPAGAGALNFLPGVGNFYLAAGNAGESSHYLYGFLNLITWPLSIIWGVPEAVVDANSINQRELIYFYTFDEAGKHALEEKGLSITAPGKVEKINTEEQRTQ